MLLAAALLTVDSGRRLTIPCVFVHVHGYNQYSLLPQLNSGWASYTHNRNG